MQEVNLALLAGTLLFSLFGAITAVRYETGPTEGRRLARYGCNVLALVCGFGLGQGVAGALPAQLPENLAESWASFAMLATLALSFLGAFAAMALVQVIEHPLRLRNGLAPVPYRLVRFDLLRW
ncbi:hypothetical protein [Ferrovibrio sp.]|uniref:hypothetical protein n=1 Tax=Ferrovibrio sp. TaxID=1917215 RepID=UPI003D2E1A3A